MSVRRVIHAIAATAILSSCETSELTESPHVVKFIVEADPGVPLPRAQILVDGDPVGQSDAKGVVWATVRGHFGRQLQIKHDCPVGYVAPPEPKSLRLRRVAGIGADDPAAIEITLTCRPTDRLAVFVVRAANGHDLPVLLDGVQVARTNRLGIAHFSARRPSGAEFAVELDTRERPRVVPHRPTRLFSLPDADEIFVFNQSFELRHAPKRRRPHRRKITKIE